MWLQQALCRNLRAQARNGLFRFLSLQETRFLSDEFAQPGRCSFFPNITIEKMSLDFTVTQFYRLLLDDIVLLYDAYHYYARNRRYKERSFKEFSEALVDLTDTETQNFEDIDVKKLTKDEEESVTTIVWDYLHSVIIRYLLDDASQFPFWRCKMKVLAGGYSFGTPLLFAFHHSVLDCLKTRRLRTIYEGFGPYMAASLVVNINYLVKLTNQFTFAILSKIPSPPSVERDVNKLAEEDHLTNHLKKLTSHQIHAEAHAKGVIPGIVSSFTPLPPVKGNRKDSKAITKQSSWIKNAMISAATTFLSHPALVVATHMVCNPLCQGSPWMVAYIKVLTDHGVSSFYRGLKLRTLVNILPYSSFAVMAVVDNFVYKHILSQVHIRDIAVSDAIVATNSMSLTSTNGSNMLSYLNYGLLTLAHCVPGFICFLGMRGLGRIVFGESVHRRHQRLRRKDIVEAYLTKLKKRHDHK